MSYQSAIAKAKEHRGTPEFYDFVVMLKARVQYLREAMDDCRREDLPGYQKAVQELKNLIADLERDKRPRPD